MERGSFPTVLEPEDVETGHPWAQASLRIASEEMTADAITELLGMKPTTKRLSEGEPSFTVWALDSGLDPSAPLEDHLYFLAERLADHHDGLAEVVSRANVEIWLSYSRGSAAPRAQCSATSCWPRSAPWASTWSSTPTRRTGGRGRQPERRERLAAALAGRLAVARGQASRMMSSTSAGSV